jgi:hypothetical protein
MRTLIKLITVEMKSTYLEDISTKDTNQTMLPNTIIAKGNILAEL